MNVRRVGGVASAGLLALLAGTSQALATDGSASTGTSAEAWYATAPACEPPGDCSLLPEASAYPKDTLHVGITGGSPAATTYLELDDSALPDDARLSGGKLTLPVDTSQGDGSLAPETAHLVACVVTESFDKAEGSLTKPPAADCETATAAAQFTPDPEPAFTVDLTTFAASWADGVTPRLALLPSPDAKDARETWHVTFWGRKNENPDAAPITADLKYTTGVEGIAPPPGADQEAAGWADDAGPVLRPPPAVPASAPETGALDLEDAAAPPGKEPRQPELAPQAQAAPEFRTVGYAYPGAWIMPLLLLVGFIATGCVLTKRLDQAR